MGGGESGWRTDGGGTRTWTSERSRRDPAVSCIAATAREHGSSHLSHHPRPRRTQPSTGGQDEARPWYGAHLTHVCAIVAFNSDFANAPSFVWRACHRPRYYAAQLTYQVTTSGGFLSATQGFMLSRAKLGIIVSRVRRRPEVIRAARHLTHNLLVLMLGNSAAHAEFARLR